TYNVVLITVDTLRADLGFSGYPRPVSPNIDALASRGTVFEHAYAMASYTMKCLGPMLIGRFASETYRDYEHYTTFYPANVFLAERVRAGGGRTLGAATHRYFAMKKGIEQGFDVWDTSAIPPNSSDNETRVTSDVLSDVAIGLLSSPRAEDIPTGPDGKPTHAAKPGAPRAGRFFAWFHYLDPHLPYVPHDDAPRFAHGDGIPDERAAYDSEVWFTDKHIGRLLDHVAKQPWAAETAIVLTADHGEAFGEHALHGHGRELWEPLVRVPLLVYLPGAEPTRVRVKRSHIDIVPTVLDLMGLPADPSLPGASLVTDIVPPRSTQAEERDVYMDMPQGPFNELRRAIITGPAPGLKLIDYGKGRSRYELYDLVNDPGERQSLSSDAKLLDAAATALARYRARLKEIPHTP
ncbi:MAG TPA: sulfatase, partial [Labilithrix sp.]|nr:sulfatase [Labilithrix sp.]